ncbi:hypothetical protein GGS24DRAFT_445069 [Hypoxylon argillaceum]|nr:hypothetical protein GGS24DRAFT_445069 [Hypoxylon argillaceum]KAI1150946.1 hypothetical protein F4825DRAFT_451967 [Nemania diffusa]
MPFFSNRKPEEEVVEEPTPVPEKKHSLFGSRHRSPSPSSVTQPRTSSSSSQISDATSNPSRHRSVLSRTFGHGNSSNPDIDPSILQARERVMGAENAEREADRALAAARLRVSEAREEVKRIEIEAAEEARRAKIKQYHAKEVSKRGKQLGRHDL